MPLEKHYSLSSAAKVIGVDRETLKAWLRTDLGIVLPRVRHGGKVLIRERDLETILARRRMASLAVSR
jgi:predicted site-specific integrase-resolvase